MAEKVGGSTNGFKFVQVPINVLMPEALIEQWQQVQDSEGVSRPKLLVAACADLDLNLISSQPLAQGATSKVPLSRVAIPEIYNLAARHLQMIRSIPSRSLKSTVVGMKQAENVRANLEVIKKPPMNRQEFFDGIKPIRRSEFVEEELEY